MQRRGTFETTLLRVVEEKCAKHGAERTRHCCGDAGEPRREAISRTRSTSGKPRGGTKDANFCSPHPPPRVVAGGFRRDDGVGDDERVRRGVLLYVEAVSVNTRARALESTKRSPLWEDPHRRCVRACVRASTRCVEVERMTPR